MSVVSIVSFFLYSYSFGIGLGIFVKESEDFLERNLIRIGIGLGSMLTFGLLLNLIRIPLDWQIFLFISILFIVIKLFIEFKKDKNILKNLKNFRTNISALMMLVLFFISLYMYVNGAFSYPWLEDDDSWSHALGVKYVSIEKTVFAGVNNKFHYIDPYPPAYDMLFGILHQTNNSVYWTLKFFNALIVSLSIIFFYFFAKLFTNSSKKALFSTFALFAIPAFLSHFIWAIALTMPLFFVSFYTVEKLKDDSRWWIVAAIVIAATLTISPTHSTYFGLFFIIYFVARTLAEKKFLRHELLAGFCGLLLSFILWWLPMITVYGLEGTLRGIGFDVDVLREEGSAAFMGTGDRVYTLSDFIFAKSVNMINNPIGIGVVLSILTVIGLIFIVFKYKDMFKKENYYKLVLVLWFVFTLYAVNAAKMQIKLSPFRTWMLFAIPVSIISGEAINLIDNFTKAIVKNFVKSNRIVIAASLIVLGLIAYGVITTSFVQKYAVNTALWGPGAFWTSNDEIQGYIWFKENIPDGTKVFTFSNNALVIGLDKFICHWCDDVQAYQRNGFNQTIEQNYNWLKKDNYKYIVIDGQSIRKFGVNETNSKIQRFINSNKFRPIFSNNGMIIFEVI